MDSSRPLRLVDGVPVVGWDRAPGRPPVVVHRVTDTAPWDLPVPGAHAHDFLVLLHAVRADGSIVVDGREWAVSDGDVLVLGPGQVVTLPITAPGPLDAWAVMFPADAVSGATSSWRAHPLLHPFARGRPGDVDRAQRLRVPPAERPRWPERLAALADELAGARPGAREAVSAHLTLLLVDVARLSGVPDDDAEPVLAAALEVIDTRYDGPLSLVDVAAAVGLSPNHLTTVVRRRTGRTVLAWITERRMDAARRLLAETDLPVGTVGRRVGFDDDGYFIRRFRREHGRTPGRWRREHHAGG